MRILHFLSAFIGHHGNKPISMLSRCYPVCLQSSEKRVFNWKDDLVSLWQPKCPLLHAVLALLPIYSGMLWAENLELCLGQMGTLPSLLRNMRNLLLTRMFFDASIEWSERMQSTWLWITSYNMPMESILLTRCSQSDQISMGVQDEDESWWFVRGEQGTSGCERVFEVARLLLW